MVFILNLVLIIICCIIFLILYFTYLLPCIIFLVLRIIMLVSGLTVSRGPPEKEYIPHKTLEESDHTLYERDLKITDNQNNEDELTNKDELYIEGNLQIQDDLTNKYLVTGCPKKMS